MKNPQMVQLFCIFVSMLVLIPAHCEETSLTGGASASVTDDSVAGYHEDGINTFIVADGTIQGAVDNAEPGDVINLLKKTYYETVDIDKSVKVIGAGKKKTIVNGDTNGDGVGEDSVFTILGDNTVTLKDITITNGNAIDSGSGGGISNNEGILTVDNCDINNNNGYWVGGGISNYRGSLTVDSCDISNNYADYGGGVANLFGKVTVLNSDIHQNSRSGIWNFECPFSDILPIVTVVDSRIHHNTGGGIDNELNGVMNIYNCRIDYNTDYSGAGINNLEGFMTIDSSTIENNEASDYGGGILSRTGIIPTGSLTVLNSKITHNIADADNDGYGLGGGIAWWDGYGSGATLINNKIDKNSPNQVYQLSKLI